jgi:hypothetical protein
MQYPHPPFLNLMWYVCACSWGGGAGRGDVITFMKILFTSARTWSKTFACETTVAAEKKKLSYLYQFTCNFIFKRNLSTAHWTSLKLYFASSLKLTTDVYKQTFRTISYLSSPNYLYILIISTVCTSHVSEVCQQRRSQRLRMVTADPWCQHGLLQAAGHWMAQHVI